MTTDRYNRQLLLDSFSLSDQQTLLQSRVAVAGLGALGTHHAEMFARMGVWTQFLIDRDFVELDNLNRQALFTEKDAADRIPKAEAAKRHLLAINSEARYIAHVDHLGPRNIKLLLKDADLIIDGTDNFITRYLINDYARSTGKPYIYCGVVGYEAACFPILPGGSCLRCLFRDIPDASTEPACDTSGVWPPAVSLISSLAVDLALRWILRKIPPDGWPIYHIDLAEHIIGAKKLLTKSDPACPSCHGKYDFLDLDETDAIHMCGTDTFQVLGSGKTVNFDAVAEKIMDVAHVNDRRYFLEIETADGALISLFRDGRAIIRGASDSGRAKAIYDKYIGS